MTMKDSLDFTSIFGGGIVRRIKDELLSILRQIGARPISPASLDYHHQTAGLSWVVGSSMINGGQLPGHDVKAPMPGKDPNGSDPVDPKRFLQLLSRFPQTSSANVPTTLSLASK